MRLSHDGIYGKSTVVLAFFIFYCWNVSLPKLFFWQKYSIYVHVDELGQRRLMSFLGWATCVSSAACGVLVRT